MDKQKKTKRNSDDMVIKKSDKTIKKIQKSRQNIELVKKEDAEFDEIRRILECIENDTVVKGIVSTPDIVKDSNGTIPHSIPWPLVFNDESLFALFNEESISLINFIEENENPVILGENGSPPTEETLRRIISRRALEALLKESDEREKKDKHSAIDWYILYLMSVHEDHEFVAACFDFLNFRRFRLRFEEVGRVLINCAADELFEYSEEAKSFIWILGRITLDEKIRSGHLYPVFSTLLNILCEKAVKKAGVASAIEIADLLHFREENPILLSEICRTIDGFVFPILRDLLVLKTVIGLLKCEDDSLLRNQRIQIAEIKLILKKSTKGQGLMPLDLYCLLQLVIISLPGVTATVEDAMEINAILTHIDRKLNKNSESTDLIRLKREIAKVKTLVANNTVLIE